MDVEHKERQLSFVIDIISAQVWHGKIFLEVHSKTSRIFAFLTQLSILSLDTERPFSLSFMQVINRFKNFPFCVEFGFVFL